MSAGSAPATPKAAWRSLGLDSDPMGVPGRHLAVCFVAFGLACPAAAGASGSVAPRPQPAGVTFAVDTKERGAAVSRGVRIARHRIAAKRHAVVVYSARLPHLRAGLAAGEHLKLAGTVLIDRCNRQDLRSGGGYNQAGNSQAEPGSPCERMPNRGTNSGTYRYAPQLEARLIRASGPADATPARRADVLDVRQRACPIHPHHCPLHLRSRGERLRGRGGEYLNVIVTAWSRRRVKPGDVVAVAGECRNGSYFHCRPAPRRDADQQASLGHSTLASGASHGQFTVIRLGPQQSLAGRRRDVIKGPRRIPIDTGLDGEGRRARPVVVFSVPLIGADPGDVIAVAGRGNFKNDPANRPYVFHHHINMTWVLSRAPGVARPRPHSSDRWLAPAASGRGCSSARIHHCTLKEFGATVIPRGASATPGFYVNFIVGARDSRADNERRRFHALMTSGRFRLTCFTNRPDGDPCTPARG